MASIRATRRTRLAKAPKQGPEADNGKVALLGSAVAGLAVVGGVLVLLRHDPDLF